MKKLFVPIDFDKDATYAADYALQLAQNIQAEVHLFHAYVFPFTPIDVPALEGHRQHEPHAYVSQDVIDHLKSQMDELVDDLRKRYPDVRIEVDMDEAFPERAISEKALEKEADVIIMTPRQIPRFLKWITGSVSQSVVNKSQVPVLIVPRHYRFETPNQLLYASNFDRVDGEKITAFMNLFENKPARLFVSFIFNDKGRDYPQAQFSVLRDVLEDHIRKSHPEADMRFLVEGEENLFEGLEEQIEDYGIDMLAMTTHQRGFFERLFNPSKTHRMIYETKIPLLIFHAETQNEGILKEAKAD